jgi:hypothetical protein
MHSCDHHTVQNEAEKVLAATHANLLTSTCQVAYETSHSAVSNMFHESLCTYNCTTCNNNNNDDDDDDDDDDNNNNNNSSMVLVHKRTIPTEKPPHVGEVSNNFCGQRVCRVVSTADPLWP